MVIYMLKDKLRYLRKHQELSQAEVAKKLKLTQPTYNRYETGTHPPDIETLKRIADFFDVSTDYLLENDKTISDNANVVDFNNFILNGNYTIHSRFPTKKERVMINDIINAIFKD